MRNIFTIGYEGASLSEFIDTLTDYNVDILLDVREFPGSRRKGFSKTALAQAAVNAGVEYRHEKSLGSPRDIRHKLREDGNYKSYFSAFEKYLGSQLELLEELSSTLKGNVALMCYEKDPLICHRRVVARALGEIAGRKPKHIGIQKAGKGVCAKQKGYAFS